jgi:hypothetical protein
MAAKEFEIELPRVKKLSTLSNREEIILKSDIDSKDKNESVVKLIN